MRDLALILIQVSNSACTKLNQWLIGYEQIITLGSLSGTRQMQFKLRRVCQGAYNNSIVDTQWNRVMSNSWTFSTECKTSCFWLEIFNWPKNTIGCKTSKNYWHINISYELYHAISWRELWTLFIKVSCNVYILHSKLFVYLYCSVAAEETLIIGMLDWTGGLQMLGWSWRHREVISLTDGLASWPLATK